MKLFGGYSFSRNQYLHSYLKTRTKKDSRMVSRYRIFMQVSKFIYEQLLFDTIDFFFFFVSESSIKLFTVG